MHMLSEQKSNNEHIFIEKTTALEAWKKVQEKNDHTATVVATACRTILELHIPEEAPVEANIQKLDAGVRDSKTEMAKAQFELNLKIIDLELKTQPSTPPEVKE